MGLTNFIFMISNHFIANRFKYSSCIHVLVFINCIHYLLLCDFPAITPCIMQNLNKSCDDIASHNSDNHEGSKFIKTAKAGETEETETYSLMELSPNLYNDDYYVENPQFTKPNPETPAFILGPSDQYPTMVSNIYLG